MPADCAQDVNPIVSTLHNVFCSQKKIHFQKGAALRRKKVMNGLVIVLIGIVALGAGYLFYGRWLAKKWGIDPNAKTPAYTHEDGEDYVPSSNAHG